MISAKYSAYLLAGFFAVLLFSAHSETLAENHQERIHRMSHHVMNFDMSKTIHVFRMTEFGGIQKVLVRDPSDTEQLVLIRQHLRHEAKKFGIGDYSDPVKLHGADMPGLAELSANSAKVEVFYSELPAGAQLTFETKDLSTLTAIHRWFGAQLSEHGPDARAE